MHYALSPYLQKRLGFVIPFESVFHGLFLKFSQVLVYDYTCHVTTGMLAEKLGCCLVVRRNLLGCSLLVWLLKHLRITDVSSESLSMLLKEYNVNMRKTATKRCKIQALCKVDAVMKDLSAEEATALAEKMKEMESRKKNKKQ